MRINILIVEDEALLRDSLTGLLRREEFTREIYHASNLQQVNEKMAAHKIDLMLLDMRLRGCTGIDILKAIRGRPGQPKVLAVTGLEGVEVIINLLKIGVNGVVSKLDGYCEILTGIKSVMNTGVYIQSNVLKVVQSNSGLWEATPPVSLTFHERELLLAIAHGHTTKQISGLLKMTESTTETYRIRLIHKFGVSNSAALIAYSFNNGLL